MEQIKETNNRNPARGRVAFKPGAIAWLLQRATAVLIALFISLHLWQRHYGIFGKKVTFDIVSERLQSPLWIFLDLALLAVLLFHSLNAIRGIVLDFGISQVAERFLFWILVMAGLAIFCLGALFLVPFIINWS